MGHFTFTPLALLDYFRLLSRVVCGVTLLKKMLLDIHGGDKEKVDAILDSEPLPLTAKTLEARKRGDKFALSQELPKDWAKKRPEELSSGQFVELTRLAFHSEDDGRTLDEPLGKKVWRKVKHGD